ncbi:response regulator transcription factor [Dyadobacter sp. CY312]|uniref:response regulator transcription factor n=1 Tax=Dyadobacter sp. CY312 TaxID=2907303 RepID=UPI001F2C1646|nr:response regulator transcription factor [Dyadobacter sp. CY312]MCE7042806.1 response regulator transcription factor [Dyadobacter sp. CY312]
MKLSEIQVMRILIIDEYPIIRKGLSLLLRDHYSDSDIFELDNFKSIDTPGPDLTVDLIIVGINQVTVPENPGLINRMKQFFPGVSLIVYDEQVNSEMLINYLRSDVKGYLSKTNDLNELMICITDVLNGKKYVNSEVLIDLLLKNCPDLKKREKKRNSTLTSHEHEIAQYLSQGMKTSLIAQTFGRKVSTISAIKANIFKKLEVDNVVSLKEVIR